MKEVTKTEWRQMSIGQKLAYLEEVRDTYPPDHAERVKIEKQILEMEEAR